MNEYHMIWANEIKTHDCNVTIDDIASICAYCYDCSVTVIFPGIIDNMKKGQTASHTFPNGDKLTITALEDISLPF